MSIEKMEEDQHADVFVTEIGNIMGPQIISILDEQTVKHTFIKEDIFTQEKVQKSNEPAESFLHDGRYAADKFYSIIPDTRAAGVSSAAINQIEAF